jgi:hypothetical protein
MQIIPTTIGGPDFGHKPLSVHRHLFAGHWSLPIEAIRLLVIPDFANMGPVQSVLYEIKSGQRLAVFSYSHGVPFEIVRIRDRLGRVWSQAGIKTTGAKAYRKVVARASSFVTTSR